jgi:1-acyl-sn-glycerol-3-phosphate acyltransferase
VRGRPRLPTVRTALFALRYGINDSIEIVVAPFLRILRPVLGPTHGSRPYRMVQRWSIRTLAQAADRLLGVRLDRAAALPVPAGTGPLIVISRHVSLLDASLPSLVFGLDSAWQVRGVVTDDALADPGFDLIYPALGTVFIDRDDARTARAVLAAMARFDGADDVVTIFPEGRLFRPDVLARSLDRMRDSNPGRHERLAGLRHVLPPRPGGVLALLAALPTADVVVLGHVGFEAVASLRDMTRVAPIDTTVILNVRRIRRSEVPVTPDEQVVWLDRIWLELDDWIDELSPTSPAGDE